MIDKKISDNITKNIKPGKNIKIEKTGKNLEISAAMPTRVVRRYEPMVYVCKSTTLSLPVSADHTRPQFVHWPTPWGDGQVWLYIPSTSAFYPICWVTQWDETPTSWYGE